MKKLIIFTLFFVISLSCANQNVAARPVCNDTDFYEYGTNTDTLDEDVEWQHTKTNPTAYPETVIYTLARTQHASASTTVEVESNAIVYKVGLNLEVTFGVSQTVSEQVGYVIPPNSTRTLEFGHHSVATYGVLRHYTMFCAIISNNSENAQWSYESFSR